MRDNSWKQRFDEAHKAWFEVKFPGAWKDGHYVPTKYPDITKANGLQKAINDYLEWTGHYCNRVNTQGRKLEGGKINTVLGTLSQDKWIPGQTKKGTADLDTIIAGKPVKLEVKVGRDKPSDDQLKQKKQVERAGGMYFFVHNMIEFYEVYDRIVSPELFL